MQARTFASPSHSPSSPGRTSLSSASVAAALTLASRHANDDQSTSPPHIVAGARTIAAPLPTPSAVPTRRP